MSLRIGRKSSSKGSSAVRIRVKEKPVIIRDVNYIRYNPLTRTAEIEVFDPKTRSRSKEYVIRNVVGIDSKHYLDGLLVDVSSWRKGRRSRGVTITITTDEYGYEKDSRYLWVAVVKNKYGEGNILYLYYGPLCRDRYPESCNPELD